MQTAPAVDPQLRREGMPGLKGKNGLVTGGSSGIGQAVAVRFAEHGADVAVNYLTTLDEATRTKEQLHASCARSNSRASATSSSRGISPRRTTSCAPGLARDYVAKHAIDFWLTSEDLPDPTRSPSDPVRLSALGCHQACIPRWSVLSQQTPIAGIAHSCGTIRFGTDPKRSALDVTCEAHDVDNLYLVDTSFFPSSSAVNPALTAIANALRVDDHLLDRLGAPSATRDADEQVLSAKTESHADNDRAA
jgi:choline dehydrogenase-like flavoprotein